MTDDPLLISDGYTATKTVPGAPGLHPDLKISYRPALARERIAYRQRAASSDPDVLDAHEVALLQKHLVSINGVEYREKDKLARMVPAVRAQAVDLVLGYTPADEAADAKNSRSA